MKDLLKTLDLVLLVALLFGLFFLFSGEPDLWDALHEKAMRWAKQGEQT